MKLVPRSRWVVTCTGEPRQSQESISLYGPQTSLFQLTEFQLTLFQLTEFQLTLLQLTGALPDHNNRLARVPVLELAVVVPLTAA